MGTGSVVAASLQSSERKTRNWVKNANFDKMHNVRVANNRDDNVGGGDDEGDGGDWLREVAAARATANLSLQSVTANAEQVTAR